MGTPEFSIFFILEILWHSVVSCYYFGFWVLAVICYGIVFLVRLWSLKMKIVRFWTTPPLLGLELGEGILTNLWDFKKGPFTQSCSSLRCIFTCGNNCVITYLNHPTETTETLGHMMTTMPHPLSFLIYAFFFISALRVSFLFLFSFFWSFLGPHPWRMEVPRIGVRSELQLLAYAPATVMPDPSHVSDLHHSLWQCWIL